MTLHVIEKAEPREDFTVALQFRAGRAGVVNFRPTIAHGGVVRVLADPARFARLKVGERGRTLVWLDDKGEEIDFCADALGRPCLAHAAPTRKPRKRSSGRA